jgi:peptide/nickel transport system substrate-binding protein
MKTKLSLLMAVLLTVSLVLSACGGAAEEPVAEEPAAEEPVAEEPAAEEPATQRYPKITIGVAADPQDLSPWDWNSGSHPYIFQNFYETLFDFEDNDYVPLLAKGYTVIDDLHWNVELYDNIYDHAGNHITADDVVFAVNYYVDNGHAVKYDMFGSIKKVDDYTVEYTWTRPITGVGDLEHPWCRTPIYSQKAFESGNFATDPVGTGVYVVKEFVSGSKVVLEANDDYWQTDESKITYRHKANVQTIEYDVIAEKSQHVIALQTGAIDVSELVPVENLADFQDGGEFADQYDVLQSTGSQVYGLVCNMFEGEPGSDINFRLAVWYAVDNEAVATATGGLIFPSKAYGTPHFPDYVTAWEDKPNYMTTFDPELAKEYLAKTDYDGQTLRFIGGAEEPVKTMATVVQSFLTNIGINTEMTLMEGKQMGPLFGDPESYDIMLYQLGGGSQIGEWNRPLNYNEYGNDMSHGFIHDEKLQELFLTARTAATHNDETMTALHDYILEKAYHYAIGSPIINMVYPSNMTDLVFRENEFLMPGACTYTMP